MRANTSRSQSNLHAGEMLLMFLLFFNAVLPKPLVAEEKREEQHKENRLDFTKDQLEEFGIEIKTAGPGTLKITVPLPGEVVVDFDQLSHISPRFPGLVVGVKKHIGEHVEKGDVLALVESNESLNPYQMKSLIDGTILEKHITLGEMVKDDTEAFLIANLENVWINLSVFQKYLPIVRKGQEVVIRAGEKGPTALGEISYLSPTVDKHTRTATARIVLPNRDGVWRPGLFVTADVVVEDSTVPVIIPRGAVQTVGGRTVVFVRDGDELEPRVVNLGRNDPEQVEIRDGLRAGDRYVSGGSFILKSELEKEGFEAGHGH